MCRIFYNIGYKTYILKIKGWGNTYEKNNY